MSSGGGGSFMLPGHVKRLKMEYWKGKETATASSECQKKGGATGAQALFLKDKYCGRAV